ncbi:divalent cation tolerance protein CutA [Streptomyces avidinii]|uniref:divalent cation tolerance protein CutA n=1 Tax=Streptomyces avidinii TaxID=1895 RepID=UPI003799FDF6
MRPSFETTAEKVAELQTWVHERHPYEVPQWIVLPTTAAPEGYLAWVVKETRTR